MSGVANGVRVMATSTPARQQDNAPTLACGCAVLTVLQRGQVDGASSRPSLFICWLMACDSPAASVIDSNTGGTPLTKGMPGTCMHTHSILQTLQVAHTIANSVCQARSGQSRQPRAASIHQVQHTLQDPAKAAGWVQATSCVSAQYMARHHAPAPGRVQAPCQPRISAVHGSCVSSHISGAPKVRWGVRGMACHAAKRRARQRALHNVEPQLDGASHMDRNRQSMAWHAADSGLVQLRAEKMKHIYGRSKRYGI